MSGISVMKIDWQFTYNRTHYIRSAPNSLSIITVSYISNCAAYTFFDLLILHIERRVCSGNTDILIAMW